jgi:hypothetical protein
MPTNFERAKVVIDALLPVAAELVTGSVDDLVGTRLASLRFAYSGQLLKNNRNAIDYSKLTTKIGYVYRSLPAHADWVYQALQMAPRSVERILSQKRVKVCCIGGGPGSDILGVVKFLEQNDLDPPELDVTVLDYDPMWKIVRRELIKTFEFDLRRHTHQDFDAGKDGKWTDSWAFVNSDIVTFSFSLSEFWSFNESGAVSNFVDRLLTGMKAGALIVYVDNGGPDFCALAEAEFDRDDVELVGSRDSEKLLIGFDERRDVLEDAYKARFKNEWTKMRGNVALRVWKKL